MAKEFFNKDQRKRIKDAIKTAEMRTSGEIVVHIENHCREELQERVDDVFDELNIDGTTKRNGVLFYLALADQKFAIKGDIGITEKVTDTFWDKIYQRMESSFKTKDYTQGLVAGIIMAGDSLRHYFPHFHPDPNELPDEVYFNEN